MMSGLHLQQRRAEPFAAHSYAHQRNTLSLAHTLNAQVTVDARAQCCAATGGWQGSTAVQHIRIWQAAAASWQGALRVRLPSVKYALCCSLLLTCGGLPDACVAVRLVPARLLLVSGRAAHGGVRLRAGGDAGVLLQSVTAAVNACPVPKQIAVRDATCCVRDGATTLTGLDVAAMTTGRNPARIIPPASFGPPSVLLRQPTRLPTSPLPEQLSHPRASTPSRHSSSSPRLSHRDHVRRICAGGAGAA